MCKENTQLIDNKRYIVIECANEVAWYLISETRKTMTYDEALEICNYWVKYKGLRPEQLHIIEVPNILGK